MKMQLFLGFNKFINQFIGEWERKFNKGNTLVRTIDRDYSVVVKLGDMYVGFDFGINCVSYTVYSYWGPEYGKQEMISNELELQEVVNKVLTKVWSDLNS